MDRIDDFFGEYYFMSNFYNSEIFLDGYSWSTVEHYFQAQKAFDIDKDQYDAIRTAKTPRWAKTLGKTGVMRDDWDKIKYFVMKKALNEKFAEDSKLCKMLLDTGNAELIEGNSWHDNIWGDCGCSKCKTLLVRIRWGFN